MTGFPSKDIKIKVSSFPYIGEGSARIANSYKLSGGRCVILIKSLKCNVCTVVH